MIISDYMKIGCHRSIENSEFIFHLLNNVTTIYQNPFLQFLLLIPQKTQQVPLQTESQL